MKNTSDKILITAKNLFNKEGLNNVTLRQLAQKLKISQGNLNYHFKVKKDILEALYFHLVEEMDQQMSIMRSPKASLDFIYQASKLSMQIMFEYRFILLDFSYIMNNNTKIKKHYKILQNSRAQQFNFLFIELIKEELMRPEEFENEYLRLYERINIVGDGWINVFTTFGTKKSIVYYCDLLFEMIYPYLTPTGKEQYLLIKK